MNSTSNDDDRLAGHRRFAYRSRSHARHARPSDTPAPPIDIPFPVAHPCSGFAG